MRHFHGSGIYGWWHDHEHVDHDGTEEMHQHFHYVGSDEPHWATAEHWESCEWCTCIFLGGPRPEDIPPEGIDRVPPG